jgi:methanogenic corrinoid protein MtbC1
MQTDSQRIVADVLAAAAEYDIEACDRKFAAAVGVLDPLTLVRDVVSPLLREAGNRWHRGELAVVQEHMISGVVRRQLSYALDRYLVNFSQPTVLFTTLSGERHEMGILMCAVLAASQGIHCIYLGPDLPPAEISRLCAHRPVEAVALSIVTQPDVIDAQTQLAELRASLPPAIEIWVSGRASMILGQAALPAGVEIVPDLDRFQQKLAALQSKPAT